MAQAAVQLNRAAFSCVICLDRLKDPVTLPCGHNYCMSCVQAHWDREEQQQQLYSCPHCRQRFAPRPVLVKNTMLADLVEQIKSTRLQIESTHNREHQLLASFERAQRQTELQKRWDQVRLRIQDKEIDLERLHKEVLSFRRSADEAVRHSDESLTGLIRELERRRSEVEQYIRAQQETAEGRVRQLQDQLQRDITELRRTQAQLEGLALTQDLNQFLQDYPPLSSAEASPRIQTQPLCSFEQVTAAVPALIDLLQVTLTEGLDNISLALTQEQHLLPQPKGLLPVPQPKGLLPQPEPKTREEFINYSREILLDANTAHEGLSLSRGNRQVQTLSGLLFLKTKPDNSDRFSFYKQVLSREGLTGRCYWEVEWKHYSDVVIAVSYKNIGRKGGSRECGFGYNDKSWALACKRSGFSFWFHSVETRVSCSVSDRIGVYLDHSAGVLSFYNIQDQTMSLLHRVQATFTQPLYAGVRLDNTIDEAYFPKLK